MQVAGVGCVLFRYKDEAAARGDGFDLLEFKKDIADSIEKLENVSNLKIFGEDDRTVGFRSFEKDEEGFIFPIACGFRLEFDLHVPAKAQLAYGRQLSCEHFHIVIVYGYNRPVMYCSFYDYGPLHTVEPGYCVSVIRKFLADRIEGTVLCTSIGPSPFHANFELVAKAASNFRLIDTTRDKAGYSQIRVESPEDDVLEDFINKTTDTFSTFYYLVTQRNKVVDQQRQLVTETKALLEREAPSFLERIASPFAMAGQIDQVHKIVIGEKLSRLRLQSFLDEAARSELLGGGTPLGKFFIEFSDFNRTETWNEFSAVANFFEDRRQRLFGNMSVLVGGIVGGIIGALIGATLTALLSK